MSAEHHGQHLQGCVSCYDYVERGMVKMRLNAEWSRRASLPEIGSNGVRVFDVNSLYPANWRDREFDALLVGPPTTGGLIRHRARRPRGRLLRFVSGVVDALGGWLR